MSRVAGLPLLPAAAVTVGLALLASATPVVALAVAASIALGAMGLAAMSAERMRRLAWIAVALAAVGVALRVALPPAAGPDLGAFAELRATLGEVSDALRSVFGEYRPTI